MFELMLAVHAGMMPRQAYHTTYLIISGLDVCLV